MKQTTLSLGKRAREGENAEPETKKFAKLESINDTPPEVSGDPLSITPPKFRIADAFRKGDPEVVKKDPGLDLLYFKSFLAGAARKQVFEHLLRELPWHRVQYKIRDKDISTPRWTCVWGCDETGADAAAYRIAPRKIPAVLEELKTHVEERTGAHYNIVLCNFYEDGKDSISWHSDDEAFLGPNPTIASLSLGGRRDFQMKHKTVTSAPTEKWALESGDMVVMRGTTQAQWLHAVPKRAKADGRMNLTFRRAISVKGTNNYYHYNVNTGPVHRWLNGAMRGVSQ